MTEITVHLGNSLNNGAIIHIDWAEKNGPHHQANLELSIFSDELTISVNEKTLCAVLPNDKMVLA